MPKMYLYITGALHLPVYEANDDSCANGSKAHTDSAKSDSSGSLHSGCISGQSGTQSTCTVRMVIIVPNILQKYETERS